VARIYSGPTELRGGRTVVYASPQLICEFELNRAGIAKIAVSAPVKAAVHSLVVRRAMPYAIQISPVRTYDYVSSFNAVDTYAVIAGMPPPSNGAAAADSGSSAGPSTSSTAPPRSGWPGPQPRRNALRSTRTCTRAAPAAGSSRPAPGCGRGRGGPCRSATARSS
jgi:hypothetical protein